jgi:hypothetical protein
MTWDNLGKIKSFQCDLLIISVKITTFVLRQLLPKCTVNYLEIKFCGSISHKQDKKTMSLYRKKGNITTFER